MRRRRTGIKPVLFFIVVKVLLAWPWWWPVWPLLRLPVTNGAADG